MRALIATAVIAASVSMSQTSAAREPESSPKLVWNERWHRVSGWHIGATAAMGAASLALQFGVEAERRWTGGVLFDEALHDRVRLESPGLRRDVMLTGDVLYFSMLAYPLIVDSVLVAWAAHGSGDVAWETFWISAEAMTATAIVSSIPQVLVGRQRPYRLGCEQSADRERCDDSSSNQSFFSGHTAIAFTAAGVLCTQHSLLPLYGSEWAGTLVCGVGVGTAAVVGATRVVTGRHYPSDVAVGMVVGLSSGLLLPRALHYGFGGSSSSAKLSLVPMYTLTVQGLMLVGQL